MSIYPAWENNTYIEMAVPKVTETSEGMTLCRQTRERHTRTTVHPYLYATSFLGYALRLGTALCGRKRYRDRIT